MENFKIDVNDILRFTGIGIFMILILGYESPEMLLKLKEFGVVSLIILSFISGNIFYYAYRNLLYETVLIKIKDKLFKDQKYYTRSYFITCLGCHSTKEANLFLHYLRGTLEIKGLKKEASSVHLMYMTAVILILTAMYKIYFRSYLVTLELLVLCAIIGISAFLSDRAVEKYDYNQIRKISQDELIEYLSIFRSYQNG